MNVRFLGIEHASLRLCSYWSIADVCVVDRGLHHVEVTLMNQCVSVPDPGFKRWLHDQVEIDFKAASRRPYKWP